MNSRELESVEDNMGEEKEKGVYLLLLRDSCLSQQCLLHPRKAILTPICLLQVTIISFTISYCQTLPVACPLPCQTLLVVP